MKGFSKIIRENLENVCTATTAIRGKLLVDGNSILHELYKNCGLEWASGGCYADQHNATVQFFEALIKAGIEPIVVLNGTSTKTQIQEVIEIRNKKDINDILGRLRKLHESSDSKDFHNHFLPLLSGQVYKASLKSMKIPVLVADGKSYELIVRLANHYECPVLTNSTNYCVSNLKGGVILIENFDKTSCLARVYKQEKFVEFLRLPNPDLIFGLAAILGEERSNSVSFIYHGPVKRDIQLTCPQAKSDERPYVLNIVDYFSTKGIYSFQDLKSRVKTFDNFKKLKQILAENCLTVEENFINMPPTIGMEELITNAATKYTSTCMIPEEIVAKHRFGNYPDNVVSAMCEGRCLLDVYVGDPEQSPVSNIGEPVRQIMYGLVKSKMEKSYRMRIEEYYRSDVRKDGDKPWEYCSHVIVPVVKFEDLSVETIGSLDEWKRKTRSKELIFSLLNSTPNLVKELSGKTASEHLLAILATKYWVEHIRLLKHVHNPDNLIKSLVLNFFISPDKEGHPLELFSDPQWIKVYHALLEWQTLYRDVCGLNMMLFSPFAELHPTHLFHGTFVTRIALDPNPDDIISTFRGMMSVEHQHLYDCIIKELLL